MLRKAALSAAVGAMAVVAVGCALTDYRGWASHQTQSEARLWGSEIAFSGTGDANTDGTYSYTVKYYPGSNVTINSYRNAVFASFSRDGMVDRDGDDIQGRGGSLGGKFQKQWVSVDATPGVPCEFFANITFSKATPQLALCNDAPSEEVDKDLDLQDAFASVGDFFAQIWSGALAKSFSLQVSSVTINGTAIPLANAANLDLRHNGIRPTNVMIDLSTPGGQDLVRALLNNTPDRQPVTLSVGTTGGMTFGLPASFTAAFDHASLQKALK